MPVALVITLALLAVLLLTSSAQADPVVDNFEWRPPAVAVPSDFNQREGELVYDRVTDELYLAYEETDPNDPDNYYYYPMSPPMRAVFARYDEANLSFDETSEIDTSSYDRWEYIYPRAYAVHNGTGYLVYSLNGTIRVREGGETTDALVVRISELNNISTVYFTLLGVFDDRIHVTYPLRDERVMQLLTVDVNTYEFERRVVANVSYFPYYTYIGMRDSKVYYLTAKTNWGQPEHPWRYWFGFLTYDIETDKGEGPFEFYSGNETFNMDYAVDSEGNLHVLMDRTYDLGKFVMLNVSPTGELLRTLDIASDPFGLRMRLGAADLVINATDCLFLLGQGTLNNTYNRRLSIWTFASDYEGPVLQQVVTEQRFSTPISSAITRNGFLLYVWESIDRDLYQMHFTVQTPKAPDIRIPRGGFRMSEDPSKAWPITLLFSVANVGAAPAKGFTMEFFSRNKPGEEFVDLGGWRITDPLEPGMCLYLNYSCALPRGEHQIRIRVRDVQPLENILDNNILEVWVYCSANNAPVVMVHGPQDSSTWSDEVVLSGTTWDLDGDTNVTTFIRGLPVTPVMGLGDWNRTIDLSGVPSGDYELVFQAYDGIGWSNVERRRVRVDHIADSLILDSLHPNTDVQLLVGQSVIIQVNVTERFSRSLVYAWRVNDSPSGTDSSLYTFIADREGTFSVEVTVTNGLTELSHTWNITVNRPEAPSLSSQTPIERVLRIHKGTSVDYSIIVVNPNDVPWSSMWTLDGSAMDGGRTLQWSHRFDSSGTRVVAVHLFSAFESSTHTWEVIIENRVPVLNELVPGQPSIEMEKDTTMPFNVLASDPDGDPLAYTWTFTNLSLPVSNVSSIEVPINHVDGMTYVITVAVSDGENTSTHSWSVYCTPQASTSEEDGLPPAVTWAIIIVVVVIAALLVSSMVYELKHERE